MQIEYSPADVETFWSRVDKSGPVPAHRPELGPCWIWTRAKAVSGGYGVFGASLNRIYRAHRFAWTITNGPIPDGLNLCHRCDNPPCVRPDHLFLGSQRSNMRDCIEKGRFVTVKGPRGETHHSARLTAVQVKEIRSRHANGERQSDLAQDYGVSQDTASRIIRRIIWKDVL